MRLCQNKPTGKDWHMPRHGKCNVTIFRCRFKSRFIRIDLSRSVYRKTASEAFQSRQSTAVQVSSSAQDERAVVSIWREIFMPSLILISGFTQKRGRILKGTEQLRSSHEEKGSEFFKIVIKIIIHQNTTTPTITNDTGFTFD